MAIFSLHTKIIGKGQKNGGGVSKMSVVAAAAYRAGARLKDFAEGVTYDFTRKQGVVFSEIALPVGAAERYNDRSVLWNEVKAIEKRADAQYCRELMVALPSELSQEECIKLARAYIRKNFVDKGMIADFSFHDPNMQGGHRNPHIHVMLTMRELTPEGIFGKKARQWNSTDKLEQWREHWAHICNKWLEKAGIDERIDHRSNKARGFATEPTVHLGTEAAAMERKGTHTAKGNINRSVRAYNAAVECDVLNPSILDNVAHQWRQVRELRSDGASPRTSTRKVKADSLLRDRADTDRKGVQRRTYTLRCNVVR